MPLSQEMEFAIEGRTKDRFDAPKSIQIVQYTKSLADLHAHKEQININNICFCRLPRSSKAMSTLVMISFTYHNVCNSTYLHGARCAQTSAASEGIRVPIKAIIMTCESACAAHRANLRSTLPCPSPPIPSIRVT